MGFPSNKVKVTLFQKLLADNEEMNFLYGKLHIRVCFAGLSQIQLQQLFTGKESLPAVVVLYFTASEKDNLPIESSSYKEQKLSQCTGKQKLCNEK